MTPVKMAVAMLNAAENVIWSERIWFANGTTWKDLESTDPNIYYPRFSDLNLSFFVGVLLLGVRYTYERLIVHPIALWLGLKEKKIFISPSPTLEQLYKATRGKALTKSDLEKAQKQTDWSDKQIQRWFFKRRLKDAPSIIFRFKDQSWQFLFYLTAFTYGLTILWNKKKVYGKKTLYHDEESNQSMQKPWLWDTTQCWQGWPKQHVSNDVYYFYLVELGFYWCLLFTLFYDVRRKDFGEMVTHHMATMLLLYMSWTCNYVRVGTLVLVLHDASDHWMAAAKMAKYCKKQTLCEVLFFTFILIWVFFRLYVYPTRILNTTYYEVNDYFVPGPLFWVFNALLMLLQILHVVWTCLIFKVIYMKCTRGKIERDIRSDTSDFEDDYQEDSEDERMGGTPPKGGTPNHVIKPGMNGVKKLNNHNNHT